MQTGSSGTLIGWKSGQTTFVPLWDRMEGAWLRTQQQSFLVFFDRKYRTVSVTYCVYTVQIVHNPCCWGLLPVNCNNVGGEVVVNVVVHFVSGCSGCEPSSAHRQSGLHTVESTFVIKISFYVLTGAQIDHANVSGTKRYCMTKNLLFQTIGKSAAFVFICKG